MISPPGWRWNDCTGHWIHARVPQNLDWWAYCDANPGARKIYEDSLPPEPGRLGTGTRAVRSRPPPAPSPVISKVPKS